jgi:hypothetical protein
VSSGSEQLLRRLLPRYFWLRDAEDGGGLLEALVRGLAGQYDELRNDVDLLYDQFFIATCDPRYVPLIGEQIGVRGLSPMVGPGVGDRTLVGRTIQLRRRKGSLATAARAVSAASGWATYIQEGRAVVTATASVRDPSADPPGFAQISGGTPEAGLGEPWSPCGRTVSVSASSVLAGEQSPGAGAAAGFPAPATVSLHVWRLMSFPVTDRTASPARDVPARFSGRAFRLDPFGRDIRLFTVPSPATDSELPPRLDELPLPLTVELLEQMLRDGTPGPVQVAGAQQLVAGDLRDWRHPPRLDHADAVVDPRLGRLLLAKETTDDVTVSYAYGFAGELGGGPYGTADDYSVLPPDAAVIQVAQDGRSSERTIEAALAAAHRHDASIVIEDSGTYTAPNGHWSIHVPDGIELRIGSAPEAAPVLFGELRARVGRQARLELSGIAIAGTLSVDGQGEVAIEHCTLVPEAGRRSVRAAKDVAVALSFAILGGVEAGDLSLGSSIADGSIACSGSLDVEQVTVLGDVSAPTLNAGDCIFTGSVTGDRGLVRTSYVGAGAGGLPTVACTGPQDGLVRFSSTRWGDPNYCQLSLSCPRAVTAGGAMGSEMGAFSWLGQPARLARVPVVLQELLPAGIGASVTYVN